MFMISESCFAKRSSYNLSQEIVSPACRDSAPDKLTGRRGLGQNYPRIDIGCVGFAASDVRLIDEQFQLVTNFLVRQTVRNLLLDRHRGAITHVFGLGRNLIWHFRRARPLLLGIFENTKPLKLSALDKFKQHLKIRFALAGKSDNKSRAQGKTGNAGAQPDRSE